MLSAREKRIEQKKQFVNQQSRIHGLIAQQPASALEEYLASFQSEEERSLVVNTTTFGASPMEYAILYYPDLEKAKILFKYKAHLNLPQGLIIMICREGNLHILKWLHQCGVSLLDQYQKDGNTALHMAMGKIVTVEDNITAWLIQVTPEALLIKNKAGLTPLDLGAETAYHLTYIQMTYGNHPETLKKELIKHYKRYGGPTPKMLSNFQRLYKQLEKTQVTESKPSKNNAATASNQSKITTPVKKVPSATPAVKKKNIPIKREQPLVKPALVSDNLLFTKNKITQLAKTNKEMYQKLESELIEFKQHPIVKEAILLANEHASSNNENAKKYALLLKNLLQKLTMIEDENKKISASVNEIDKEIQTNSAMQDLEVKTEDIKKKIILNQHHLNNCPIFLFSDTTNKLKKNIIVPGTETKKITPNVTASPTAAKNTVKKKKKNRNKASRQLAVAITPPKKETTMTMVKQPAATETAKTEIPIIITTHRDNRTEGEVLNKARVTIKEPEKNFIYKNDKPVLLPFFSQKNNHKPKVIPKEEALRRTIYHFEQLKKSVQLTPEIGSEEVEYINICMLYHFKQLIIAVCNLSEHQTSLRKLRNLICHFSHYISLQEVAHIRHLFNHPLVNKLNPSKIEYIELISSFIDEDKHFIAALKKAKKEVTNIQTTFTPQYNLINALENIKNNIDQLKKIAHAEAKITYLEMIGEYSKPILAQASLIQVDATLIQKLLSCLKMYYHLRNKICHQIDSITENDIVITIAKLDDLRELTVANINRLKQEDVPVIRIGLKL